MTTHQRLMRLLFICVFVLVPLLGPTGAPFAQDTPATVAFPGSYAARLGGADWEPAEPVVQATDDGSGIWTLTTTLPAGDYEFKVAIDGSWDENYGLAGEPGGANIPFTVPAEGGDVVFYYDRNTGEINLGINAPTQPADPPAASGDGQFVRSAILHDSRQDAFRVPFGAQPVGSDVTLRLRTAANDVQQVALVMESASGAGGRSLPMTRLVSDGAFDWWEATIQTGATPDVLTYFFALTDGDATHYYADDGALDGETGQAYATQPGGDQGWNIYVYAEDFIAPEWAKNATIYQVFPDRFRNGDPANDPTVADWFYPEERGHAFPVSPWNTPVPDPVPNDEATNPEWYGTFSSTFYGGDIQGIQEKLEYLQSLGVDTIYLNPIFDSPSNHRYDGRDYRQVDEALAVRGDAEASNDLFVQFAAEVASRGMHLILDGVPNHTSSDSPFFDRYGRHDLVGACEAEESPYRSWFFFTPARPAGTGVCAGDTNYAAWAGYGTLPQVDTANEEVVENWLGEEGIATTWLRTPGVDGWRIDVVPDVVLINPDFFAEFRTAAKAANPDALLISETWAEQDARLRALGDEFDSTMNYRFRQALLGFLRDSEFADGDPAIRALNASEFDAALRALEEDYPPEAFATAMNLISSHDVNRAVNVLAHDGVDAARQAPVDGFVDGRQRLALAAVLQFTLPGAPTIYYGDEVGLAGFGSDPQRDDPYNRQPYPWPDAEGYDSLPDWRKQDTALLALYQQLGQLRREHAFLRTGAWETLLTDDDLGLYVFGRKDADGAAVVAVNRGAGDAEVTMNLSPFLPYGAELADALGTEAQAAGDDGAFAFDVPAMGFRIFVTDEGNDLVAPAAPNVTAEEASNSVTLTIAPGDAAGAPAASFAIHRSLFDGGYEAITVIPANGTEAVTYVDKALVNGTRYWYQVVAIGANGLHSAPVGTGPVIPHPTIASVTVTDPTVLQHTLSAVEASPTAQAAVAVPGVTDIPGAAPGVRVQIGWAPAGTEMYTWADATYVADNQGGADIYTARMLPETTGDYAFAWRATTTGGRDWQMSDNTGKLTVYGASDVDAPKPPFRLDELARSGNQVAFAWRVSRPADLYNFRICKADITAGETGCATRIDVPKMTSVFTDTAVTTGSTYLYTVQVVDNAFNVSEPSPPITLTAELSMVDVTWRVLAPAETPADATIFIAGDNGAVFGAAYNPGLQPMTLAGENLWEWKATVREGTKLLYKYTRGSWEAVEQWGAISGFGNRQMEVIAGPDGTMLVEDTATDWGAEGPDDHRAIKTWRDPLVKSTEPAGGASGPVESVSAEFSILVTAADPNRVIVVTDASGVDVPGTVATPNGQRFVFTPENPLAAGDYSATAFNVDATTPMIAPYAWHFAVTE